MIDRFTVYLKQFDQLNISIITYYEICAGLKYKDAIKQLDQFEEFIAVQNLILVSESSARIASDIYAELRKSGITIGTSDLLIAGIAIENGLTLITNNEKHYVPIRNLKVNNWKS